MAPERKYALTRISAGDYILPSNDGKTIWRIIRGDEDDGTGRVYTVWQVWRYTAPLTGPVDPEDWSLWALDESFCRTRQEAIGAAMRMGA
jgi:hypothetical protein